MRSNWGRSSGGGSWLPFAFYSIPFVRWFLTAAVGLFLIWFLVYPLREVLPDLLVFRIGGPDLFSWLARPWTLFTYPLAMFDPIPLLFSGYWLYWVGGTLERSWGSLNFAVVFFLLCAIAGLAFIPAAF